ncbi:response regulator [Solimonas soli]|uniref:response regulator n=1 Tax=Solimonas soli TaxID=413479 RepID=UPI00048389A2
MQRGLVIEDLAPTAEWLMRALREAFPGIAVELAETAADARAALQRRPDIALVDLDLPDGSGIDIIAQINARHPHCHCIVTTIYGDDRHLFPALRAGAQGYLLKDQPMERLVAALQAIDRGEPPLSPAIARRLLGMFAPAGPAPDEQKLTTRERETLVLIAKGLRLAEVAEQLGVTRNTAAGFVKAIYRKLNISSRAEAALEATRLGLVKNEF